MTKPEKLGEDGYVVPNTALNQLIAKTVIEKGRFFFKDQNQLFDAFGLALERQDAPKAIANYLEWQRHNTELRLKVKDLGFEMLDMDTLELAFTYTLFSTKHTNEPLWIREQFIADYPLIFLANMTASIFNTAYDKRPKKEIWDVSQGR